MTIYARTEGKKKQKLAIIAALIAWCVGLLLVRFRLGTDGLSLWLLWNLFLAALPLLWSGAFGAALARQKPVLAGGFWGLWLLFLPNAPYLLTDLIHLGPRPNVPLWFMLAILLSFAGTGTLLGYFSLRDVHVLVEQKFGKIWGWIMAGGSLMLCGFGIYLGRFLRWNSWDIFTRPVALMRAVAHQFIDAGPHPHPIPVTLIFGGGLLLGYLALRVFGSD